MDTKTYQDIINRAIAYDKVKNKDGMFTGRKSIRREFDKPQTGKRTLKINMNEYVPQGKLVCYGPDRKTYQYLLDQLFLEPKCPRMWKKLITGLEKEMDEGKLPSARDIEELRDFVASFK